METKLVFFFSVKSTTATLTIDSWQGGKVPDVGEQIFLYNFLEPNSENIKILTEEEYEQVNINTILKECKFMIEEKMFVRVNKDITHIQYTLKTMMFRNIDFVF